MMAPAGQNTAVRAWSGAVPHLVKKVRAAHACTWPEGGPRPARALSAPLDDVVLLVIVVIGAEVPVQTHATKRSKHCSCTLWASCHDQLAY